MGNKSLHTAFGMWLVTCITVETYCAFIHCLVSVFVDEYELLQFFGVYARAALSFLYAVIHITDVTAETHSCLYSYPLFGLHQPVIGLIFFTWRNSVTHLIRSDFNVRRHFTQFVGQLLSAISKKK